jgi:hypothetical protein
MAKNFLREIWRKLVHKLLEFPEPENLTHISEIMTTDFNIEHLNYVKNLNKTIAILDIFHRNVFYLKHVWETGFCPERKIVHFIGPK